jgi:phosphohistidine phosphatase
MPQLLIMRHAKSDWGSEVSGDRDRTLAPRGVKAAKRMGRFLTRIGAVPDLVLSSPAVRALATARVAAEAGKWNAPIEVEPLFYGGGWTDVVSGVVSRGTGNDRILVVGHEPTWSDLVAVLSGGGQVAMPTAAVSNLEILGRAWDKLGPGCAELQWHVTPRMLKAAT